jgi:hypothetical protein
MTQTGGLAVLFAWLIFAGLLTVLAYLLLRHEQDPPGARDSGPYGRGGRAREFCFLMRAGAAGRSFAASAWNKGTPSAWR